MSADTVTGPTATGPTAPGPTISGEEPAPWAEVCHLDRLVPDTGVTALVAGIQVAVFRLNDDRVYAIGNHDPCSGANVLSRGIVGDVDGRPFVASPMHKHRFDLGTGTCLDADDGRTVRFPTRLVDGVVAVATRSVPSVGAPTPP
jgi:nitrite reductase (NADH) small subunit